MEIDLRRHTGIKLALNLSDFPKELQVGPCGLHGLPSL
jgi:hypothetical protein